jgi:hypothetical protein
MAEQWLSIVEYARTFAVSDMTVRRRIKTGRLKAVLRDGKYYIPIGPNGEVLDFDDEAATPPAAGMNPALREATKARELVREPLIAREAATKREAAIARESTAPRELKREAAREAAPDGLFERPGAATFRTLPQTLSQGLQRADQSLIDSQALLQFCDNSVSRMEKQLQELYQGRIHTLEGQVKWKDGIIGQLRQQVEDLQMLVTLMEQSRK